MTAEFNTTNCTEAKVQVPVDVVHIACIVQQA
jgi:hypothetical protein